jgi:hypothetical protein
MLEILFGLIAYDTMKSISKERKSKKLRSDAEQLRTRINLPMTRSHTLNCKCRLCANRREKLVNQFNSLIGA